LLVVLVGACSGKPFTRATPPPNPLADPLAARTLANAVRSTLSEGSAETSYVHQAGSVSQFGQGEQDFRSHSSDVTTTISGRDSAGKSVSYALETRVIGDSVYIKVPKGYEAAFGNPKTPWVSTHVRSLKAGGQPLFDVNFIAVAVAVPQGDVMRIPGTGLTNFTGRISVLGIAQNLPADLRALLSPNLDLNASARTLTNLVGTNPTFVAGVDSDGRLGSVLLSSTPAGSSVLLLHELWCPGACRRAARVRGFARPARPAARLAPRQTAFD
jgi:hypothetical protein